MFRRDTAGTQTHSCVRFQGPNEASIELIDFTRAQVSLWLLITGYNLHDGYYARKNVYPCECHWEQPGQNSHAK